MASDDLRARIAQIRADAERSVHPSWRDVNPMWVLLNEIDRLTAELARHAACAVCGHERHRHGYEPIIRQDWCSDCPTTNDLHTFKAKENLS